MKFKRVIFFLFAFIILFMAVPAFAEEKINNFDVYIKINSDASILVTENINYDFGAIEKHGIFRDIPIKYQTSFGNKSVNIEVQNILKDGGKEKYVVDNIGSNKNIKIGDPNITISGKHLYVITYKVKEVIGYFENFDELYWNITGNTWPVKIESVTAKIDLPENISITEIQNSCYLGILGSTEKCDLKVENNSIVSDVVRPLNIGEGLTIAISFPKGIVYQPTKFENFISLIGDNFILFLPIVVLIIMFLIWRKYGKDPKGFSTIMAEYEPPKNITPTLIGSLMRGRVDFVDIVAGLIYLAEQGYLSIKEIEKSDEIVYKIELLKSNTSNLEKIEKNILNLFFKDDLTVGKIIKSSDFSNDKNITAKYFNVTKEIYQEMINRKFYKKDPSKTKNPYLATAMILAFICPFILGLFLGLIGIVSLGISSIIIIIFGSIMSKTTKLGAEERDHIKGFKLFLLATEKDRLKFHNAPEKKPEQFMKFLPYAIALGIEKEWAEQFENMNITQPNWYQGNTNSFNFNSFVSNLPAYSDSFSAMSGSSGSGGGGSSGGGGGGGGGGSW